MEPSPANSPTPASAGPAASPPRPALSSLEPYLLAVAAVAITAAARAALHPVLGDRAPLLLFTLPVVLSAWVGGFGPGVAALVLSAFAGTFFLEHSVEGVRAVMGLRRHQLAVSLPPEPVFVLADATRLEQVFTNLLENAAKYTPPGGRIELSLEVEGRGERGEERGESDEAGSLSPLSSLLP